MLYCKSYSHFFSKKFQRICVSHDVNFNESLSNDIVSFEQLGPELHQVVKWTRERSELLSLKCGYLKDIKVGNMQAEGDYRND